MHSARLTLGTGRFIKAVLTLFRSHSLSLPVNTWAIGGDEPMKGLNDMAYPRDISIAEAIKRYGLPKSHRVHWSKARKDDVVRAVRERAISFHEARSRYLLSRAEFEQWEADYVATRRSADRMQDA